MSDLVAFLRARLDEDEAADWHVLDCSGMPRGASMDQPCCEANARVLREVEARRAILGAWQDNERERPHDAPGSYTDGLTDGLKLAVLYWAAVYSDHPDYDPAWG